MSDLRDLAERFLSLSAEIEAVRREMLAALTNGGQSRPTLARQIAL